MCGIAGQFGAAGNDVDESLGRMLSSLGHRGPNARGVASWNGGLARLAHARLSIIDLSDAGRQPMTDPSGRWSISYNGEIYNYLELRKELESVWTFRTATDTEVLLAAYAHWGRACLDRLIGMFAFAIWDSVERELFAARDRFGVKPLFYHQPDAGSLWIASEIKALHQAGLAKTPNPRVWASYLAKGMYDDSESTFWNGARQVPPGGWLHWSAEPSTSLTIGSWYDPADRALAAGVDSRSDDEVGDELLSLLEESVRLRFRADVPVGVCLSGGLDSSLLWGLTRSSHQADLDKILAFTFACGDPNYDETPWVQAMLADCRGNGRVCRLRWEEIPDLAARVQAVQDEPFGGFPTLGMAKVHQRAAEEGVIVLLDGNGLDEGWAGYDYYARADRVEASVGPVQGSKSPTCRPDCLKPDFLRQVQLTPQRKPWGDPLRDLQYRDLRYAKIPRAMRFADRVSMLYSRELREPFLDHRIIELGLRQPASRKIRDGQGKWLPRRIAARLLPGEVRLAPKRPLQTPQREWLRDPLRAWSTELIEAGLRGWGKDWLNAPRVREAHQEFLQGGSDNSFSVWQWMSLGLIGSMS